MARARYTSASIFSTPASTAFAAWVIGARSMLKALLAALLEPTHKFAPTWKRRKDYTQRLALFEEVKTMPFGAVWDHYCLQNGCAGWAGLDCGLFRTV